MRIMKKKGGIIALVLVILLSGIGLYTYEKQKHIVLNIGLFAGSYWDVPSGDTYKIIDDVIARFEKQHPNVEVRYVSGLRKEDYSEWLSQQALKGEEPDVYVVLPDDLSTFAQIGMLENLDPLITQDKEMDTKKYFTPALKSGQYEKKQYALLYESVPTLMYVNKTLLEKEGIPLPDKHWTWEDFYRICASVTKDTNGDGKLDQFGVYGYTWQNAVASNNATIFNDTGSKASLNNAAVYDAISFARKLEQLNKGETINSDMFDKGQVAFCPMRFSEYRTYKPYPWRVKKYTSFAWDCIPMPAGPKGANVSQLDTLSIGMSASTSHRSLAWEFMKLLCYDEQTQENIFHYSQGVSVLKDVTASKQVAQYLLKDTPGDSTFTMDFLKDTMEHAIPAAKFTEYNQAMSVADSEIRRLLGTDEDVKTAINALQTKIDLILKK